MRKENLQQVSICLLSLVNILAWSPDSNQAFKLPPCCFGKTSYRVSYLTLHLLCRVSQNVIVSLLKKEKCHCIFFSQKRVDLGFHCVQKQTPAAKCALKSPIFDSDSLFRACKRTLDLLPALISRQPQSPCQVACWSSQPCRNASRDCSSSLTVIHRVEGSWITPFIVFHADSYRFKLRKHDHQDVTITPAAIRLPVYRPRGAEVKKTIESRVATQRYVHIVLVAESEASKSLIRSIICRQGGFQ